MAGVSMKQCHVRTEQVAKARYLANAWQGDSQRPERATTYALLYFVLYPSYL